MIYANHIIITICTANTLSSYHTHFKPSNFQLRHRTSNFAMVPSTKRLLLSIATIIECLKFTFALNLNIPKPETVLISVPFDLLKYVRWLDNPDYAQTTCGTFKAYNAETLTKVVGRWYTIYVSNVPSITDFCSQFTNVQSPCKCNGIDFTLAEKDGVISFVMFSTNTEEMSVTYEMATASFIGERQLNMNQIILRSFVIQSNARISGKGGFIIPSAVIVDSDNFESYLILVFCLERAVEPLVMVLVNSLPITEEIRTMTLKYLNDNDFDTRKLHEVHHKHCMHGQNIVGF